MKTKEKVKKPLQAELAQKEQLIQTYVNDLQRLQADFENYRKHIERSQEVVTKFGNFNLLKKLLTIIDDFERAVEHKENVQEYRLGTEMICNNMKKLLEEEQVTVMQTKDQIADPFMHEIVTKQSSPKKEGTILKEIQKGYLLHDKVLRPAKVIVAQEEKHGKDNRN